MKILRPMLLALCLIAFSGMAAAHDRHDRGHDRGDRHGWQDRGHGHGHGNRGQYDRHRPRGHYEVRRVAPRHHWQRGHRYGGPVYVVHDYHHRHLRRPPHGYHWVRAGGNDYLLVALATGIILDIATR